MNIFEHAVKAAAERLREGYPPVSDEQALATARDVLSAALPLVGVHATERPEQSYGTKALLYAQRLAEVLWEKHWKGDAPKWRPLPELIGTLTQIDNMTAGLVRALPAQSGSVQCREDVARAIRPIVKAMDKRSWEAGEDRVQQITDAVLALSAEPQPREGEWRPIETALKDGTPVDLWCPYEGAMPGRYFRVPFCWFTEGHWWQNDFNLTRREKVFETPTHWMALPTSPVIVEKREKP